MTARRRLISDRLRTVGWAGMGVILVARLAVEWFVRDPATAMMIADIVTYLLPIALVVVCGAMVALKTRGTGSEQRFWGALTVASVLVLLGESYWTYHAVVIDPAGPPIDSPVRWLYLGAALLVLSVGVTVTRHADEPLTGRLAFYLDTLCVMSVVYPVVFSTWTWPAFEGMGSPLYSAAIAAFYPVFGIFLVGATLGVLIGWKAYRWRVWERLAAVSLAIYGAGLFVFPFWYPAHLAAPELKPSWFTWALGSGFYLLFMAIVYRLTATGEEVHSRRWPVIRFGSGALVHAYPAVMACAMLGLGSEAVVRASDPQGAPIVVSAIALAVLLGARCWVAEVERGRHLRGAVTDHATGAYSRAYLDARLARAIAECADTEVALTVFDIDGFTRFEDQDEALAVLVEVAASIDYAINEGDEVFRLGGDQFAVVSRDSSEERAYAVAERVISAVRERLLERLGTVVGLSVGIAVCPSHARVGADLLVAARDSCRASKGTFGGRITVHGSADSAAEQANGAADSRARAARDTVIVLAAAVDARDAVTRNHSAGVAELMEPLCRALGMSEDRVRTSALAALVHDVGKIGIPDAVLESLAPLTEEERRLIKEHSELGERILEAARLTEILPIARHHHERWDGQGYPDGLAGHAIPFEARALAVCDTFETLVSGRPYQAARSVESAIAEIEANAGTQFDPMIAAVFVRMVRRELSLSDEHSSLGSMLRGSRASA